MVQASTAADTAVPGATDGRHGVSLGEAFRVWARIAALSFGGPAGQIAVMHRILVEEKRWIGEHRGSCTRSTTACCCPVPRPSSWPSTSAG